LSNSDSAHNARFVEVKDQPDLKGYWPVTSWHIIDCPDVVYGVPLGEPSDTIELMTSGEIRYIRNSGGAILGVFTGNVRGYLMSTDFGCGGPPSGIAPTCPLSIGLTDDNYAWTGTFSTDTSLSTVILTPKPLSA
jgi:hypothetical protein